MGIPSRSPIWSCSWWGLPSQPGHPGCWWSLTPPFHRRAYTQHVQSVFCGTFRRVTPPGYCPAPCSVELGLSSVALQPRSPDPLGHILMIHRIGAKIKIAVCERTDLRSLQRRCGNEPSCEMGEVPHILVPTKTSEVFRGDWHFSCTPNLTDCRINDIMMSCGKWGRTFMLDDSRAFRGDLLLVSFVYVGSRAVSISILALPAKMRA
jgi:hypothetical protein